MPVSSLPLLSFVLLGANRWWSRKENDRLILDIESAVNKTEWHRTEWQAQDRKLQMELRAKNKDDSAIQKLKKACSWQEEPETQRLWARDELRLVKKKEVALGTCGPAGEESCKGLVRNGRWVKERESLCSGEGVQLRSWEIWDRDGTEVQALWPHSWSFAPCCCHWPVLESGMSRGFCCEIPSQHPTELSHLLGLFSIECP